jgi:hypothetical protein
MHCKDTIPKSRNKYPEERNCAASVPISTFMSLWAFYIPTISLPIFCCRKICGLILGIFKSLTDTWKWKLGLRPRNSFFWEYINEIFVAVWRPVANEAPSPTYPVEDLCPALKCDALKDGEHGQNEVVEVGDPRVGSLPVLCACVSRVLLIFFHFGGRKKGHGPRVNKSWNIIKYNQKIYAILG